MVPAAASVDPEAGEVTDAVLPQYVTVKHATDADTLSGQYCSGSGRPITYLWWAYLDDQCREVQVGQCLGCMRIVNVEREK